MNKYFTLFVSIFFLIFQGCGPSDEELARKKLDRARMLLQQNDTANALLQIDSIAGVYPKAQYSINAAKNLKKEILWEMLQQKGTELDSTNAQIPLLEKNFNREKTEYDRYALYIHKRQTFDRSWKRSYIQVVVNEKGDISLISNYNGTEWLNHVALRVYDKDLSARTDTVKLDEPDSHRSDFLDSKWEKVTFRNGRDNGVIQFIADNANLKLKAVFMGKQYYYIVLEDYDKKAAAEALALSGALKKCIEIENEIKQLQAKLNQVN
ncbi:MAG: hypothetical protein FWG22_06035 [Prolixibacteraceae bacterium]|nr:hypothetical protein [Prolixibacteraceae bacterium]